VVENLRIAFAGLAANKLRSALTMLGILIGVAGVVLLLAVGSGARVFIEEQFEDLGGANVIQVFPGNFSDTGQESTTGREPALTEADVAALSDPSRAPAIELVAPTQFAQSTAVAGGNSHTPQQFIGATAPYAEITNLDVARGTMFTDDDVSGRRRVAVIGTTVEDALFPDGSAVGQDIRFGRATFEVIGVLARKGSGLAGDLDDQVIAPITAVEDTVTGPQTSYATIYAAARSAADTPAAVQQMTDVLVEEHRLPSRDELDFTVFDPAEALAQVGQVSAVLTVLLGAIASISLLVGGIGVMNIMLVTVTERTREIGIRKALGARRSDLRNQFLFEAVVVTAVGGLLGIAVGLLGSLINVSGFSPVVQPWSVGLAFGVSVVIGLFFGVYPANRAAKMRPIEALRYE
jgi:putative ABC transport system permease protein